MHWIVMWHTSRNFANKCKPKPYTKVKVYDVDNKANSKYMTQITYISDVCSCK